MKKDTIYVRINEEPRVADIFTESAIKALGISPDGRTPRDVPLDIRHIFGLIAEGRLSTIKTLIEGELGTLCEHSAELQGHPRTFEVQIGCYDSDFALDAGQIEEVKALVEANGGELLLELV